MTVPNTHRHAGATSLSHILVFFGAIIGTILVLALLQNIDRHKVEAQSVAINITNLSEATDGPAEWGKNFPRQYDSYKRTVDIQRTRYGGSEAYQKITTSEGGDDRWRTLFGGYAFGFDYREERGHAYMLSDQRETERVAKVNQPGACLHCHASNVVAYRQAGLKAGAPGSLTDPLFGDAGKAQLFKGFQDVCAMPYAQATTLVKHPVSCLDCHDPKSMQLRTTRPGFINGIQALARSSEPTPHLPSIERWRKGDRKKDYDPNTEASRQEMRSFVCGQCHVEYHFKGDGKLLTYPWHNGLKMEQAETYYLTAGKEGKPFVDWTHRDSKSPMLKAQHPEFELWSQGVHARAGVSCADCHMPYIREGAIKVSSHHVRSPLLNIAQSCQTCHNVGENELLDRVQTIQGRTAKLMDQSETAVMDLIGSIKQAMADGATDQQLTGPRDLHRRAQWRLDYIAAENSMGFHADQESARILAEAIDLARQGQIKLLKEVPQLKPAAAKPTSPPITPPAAATPPTIPATAPPAAP